MNKWLKILLVFIFINLLIGAIGLHFFSHKLIITPFKREALYSPEDYNLKADSFTILTKENFKLKGYWIKSNTTNPKACIIISHGKSSCKESNFTLAKFLADHGIESIVYDARRHGESEGEYCTFGYYEKEDVSKLVELVSQKNKDLKIGLWGHSLGAAVTIQTMAIDLRVDFGISESSFLDLRTIVRDYQKRYFLGFGSHFLADYTLSRAEEIAKFDAVKVSPLESIKKIKQPIFLAHGDLDDRISYDYGKQLFSAIPHKNKEFYTVENAKHNFLWEKGGKEYHFAILQFIQDQIK